MSTTPTDTLTDPQRRAIRRQAKEYRATPPKLVVLDLSAAPLVDMHAAQMLGSVADELTATGIQVQAVEARSSVRDRLRSEGVDAKLGTINRFSSVADAVEAFQKQAAT